jgi:hypothetical protein
MDKLEQSLDMLDFAMKQREAAIPALQLAWQIMNRDGFWEQRGETWTDGEYEKVRDAIKEVSPGMFDISPPREPLGWKFDGTDVLKGRNRDDVCGQLDSYLKAQEGGES